MLVFINVEGSALVIDSLDLVRHVFVVGVIVVHEDDGGGFELGDGVKDVDQVQILVYLFDSFFENCFLIDVFVLLTV